MCCALVVDGRLGFSGLEGVDDDPLGAPSPKREGRWVLNVTALVGLPDAVPDAAAYVFDGDEGGKDDVSFAWSLEKAGTVPEPLSSVSAMSDAAGAVEGRVAKLLAFGTSFKEDWPKPDLSNAKPPPNIVVCCLFYVPLSIFLFADLFLLCRVCHVVVKNPVFSVD